MIETIHLKHIQSHKDTVINLSPGVNVIKGTSHHGKSSILRGLTWNLLNKPKGEGIRSHFAEPSDPMEVGVEFNDGYVIRKRDKDENSYEVSGVEDPLEGFGKGDPPQEVFDVSQMSEVNLGSQHDNYFLLQDSPGEVGRKINQIVGLDIINKVLKKGNSIIKDTDNRLTICKEEIEGIDKDLEEYEFIDRAEELIQNIQDDMNNMSDLEEEVQKLENLCKDIKKERKEIADLEDWLTIKEPVFFLKDKIGRLNADQKELDGIQTTVGFIRKEREFIAGREKILVLRKPIENIKSKLLELDNLQESLRQLNTVYTDIQTEVGVQNSLNQQLNKSKELLQQKQKLLATCPKCGAYKIHWRKQNE